MHHRILIVILLISSCFANPVVAENLPSETMRELPLSKIPDGYVLTWILKIEIESTEQSRIDQCRRILLEDGYLPMVSTTTGIALSKPILKIAGTKEYSTPSTAADTILEKLKAATYGASTTFSHSVSQKLSPKSQ